jgi:hypothetical protein
MTMSSHHSQDDRHPSTDIVGMLNVVVLLIHAIGHIHALFTRRWGSMGRDYPSGFVAIVSIIFVPLLAIVIVPPSYGVGFLVPYCLLVYLLAFLHGIAKQRQTRHVHRHYIGDPWLTIGHPSRRLGEWLLGWLLVGLFFLFSNTLGMLHLVSLICAAIGQDLMEAREKRILQQMRDSQLEAEYYSNRLKGL